MNWIPVKTRAGQTCVRTTMGLTLGLMLCSCAVRAQDSQSADQKPAAKMQSAPRVELYASLPITNMTEQHEFNDVQTDLRNLVPRARIYGVLSSNLISIWGTQEELDLARKIVAELDQPEKAYLLKFTITDLENGKQAGVQHMSLVCAPRVRAIMKQGARVPIVTGSYKDGSSGENTQVQYLDVGLNIEASLDGNSVNLKVEQTNLSTEPSGMGSKDPVVRQSVLESASRIVVDKSVVLGTLDVPGTTRRQEVAMTVEPMP